jgi:predicted branched-subunit amino acid permease
VETEAAPTRHSRVDRQAFIDAIPLLIPAVPFGFVLGLAMTKSEMPLWAAWLSSPLVFAGAAQLTMVTLAGTASLWAIISAVLVRCAGIDVPCTTEVVPLGRPVHAH